MRECGARIKLISDGDMMPAISAALTGTGIDTLWQKILDHRTAMSASGEFAAAQSA